MFVGFWRKNTHYIWGIRNDMKNYHIFNNDWKSNKIIKIKPKKDLIKKPVLVEKDGTLILVFTLFSVGLSMQYFVDFKKMKIITIDK